MRTRLLPLALPFSVLLSALLAPPLPGREGQDGAERRRVAILVYPGVELLDFAGPGEVFQAAHGPWGNAFQVYTVAESAEPVVSQGFVEITPKYTLESCPPPHVLVIPGGAVPLDRPAVVEWVRRRGAAAELVMSVCNGAQLLGKAGLLNGLESTTHWGSLDYLALLCPETTVLAGRRFVDAGRMVTTAGVSAGIDGALHVVSRLLGDQAAWETARYMEYEWRPAEIAKQHAQRKRHEPEMRVQIVRAAQAEGPAAAAALYRKLEAQQAEGLPGEMELNGLGYFLLDNGGPEQAIGAFAAIAEIWPRSANAWDSLGDGYEAVGDARRAVECAEKCLALIDESSELDPAFRERVRDSATAKLQRLKEGAAGAAAPLPGPWVCPPCGADCHDVEYQAPGRCRVCRMTLVTKASVAAQSAAPSGESGARLQELEQALQSGEWPPATVLSRPEAQELLRDPATRREMRAVLARHPAAGSFTVTAPGEPGKPLRVHGRIVAPETQAPLPGAELSFYHTDARGWYAPEQEGDSENPRLFGCLRADAQGAFELRTILPASYPGTTVAQHVHYRVRAAGRADLTAEFLFDQDPNLDDSLRRSARDYGFPIAVLRELEDGSCEAWVTIEAGEVAAGS